MNPALAAEAEPEQRGPKQYFYCPDCGHKMRVQRTKQSGVQTLRIKYYQCLNVPDCGHLFKGFEEISARLVSGPGQRNQEAPL